MAEEDARKAMSVNHIVSLCGTGTCPTVYQTDRGTLLIQGYTVSAEEAGIEVPAGEHLVEIPAHLVEAAGRAVSSASSL